MYTQNENHTYGHVMNLANERKFSQSIEMTSVKKG